MKDRSVEYPNRYQFNLVGGTDNIYDVIPAPGEITEEGTPINKGTLLSEATASKLGFASTDDPTVDDAFNAVPKLSQIRQTLPVAEGMTVQAGDVVDVVDGEIGVNYDTKDNGLLITNTSSTTIANRQCWFNPNKGLIFYYNTNNTVVYAVVVTITNGIVSKSNPVKILDTVMSGITRIDDTRCVVFNNQNSKLYARIIQLVDEQIVINAELELNNMSTVTDVDAYCFHEGIIDVQGTAYNDNQTYIAVLRVMPNNTITKLTSTLLCSNRYATSAAKIDDHSFAVFYSNGRYAKIVSVTNNFEVTIGKEQPVNTNAELANTPTFGTTYIEDNKIASVAYYSGTWYLTMYQVTDTISIVSNNTANITMTFINGIYFDGEKVRLIGGLNTTLYDVYFSITNDTISHEKNVLIFEMLNSNNYPRYQQNNNNQYVGKDYRLLLIYRESSDKYNPYLQYSYQVSTTTQALALTSGTAGENVDVAYDGVFDFDGLEVGQSIYDGNDALIAYCPVAGKVNVIGYWKRDERAFVTGSYVGTGGTGSNNRNSLSWDKCPQLVIVAGSDGINSGQQIGIFVKDVPNMMANCEYSNAVIWDDTGLEWYLYSSGNDGDQLNYPGTVYHYAAFFN